MHLVRGALEILLHDQGGKFWSDVMNNLARLLDIQVSKIMSLMESSREYIPMNSVFAKIVHSNSNQIGWCEVTNHVCYAYNTAVHSCSSFDPYYLMHLRHLTPVVTD